MRRQSIIWKLSKSKFNSILKNSNSYKEALIKIGLAVKSGGNYKTLKQRIYEENIEVSHIERNKKQFRGKIKSPPLNEVLVKNSSYSNKSVKKRLLKENILKNQCSKCGLNDTWNNEPITLQLDHINGNHSDNRIKNLRILCPNCHSQTKTYSGKNIKDKIISYDWICKCGNKKYKQSNECLTCFKQPEKIKWPPDDELSVMLWSKTMKEISKDIGVSDVAIKKRANSRNIKRPPRGYWLRADRRT